MVKISGTVITGDGYGRTIGFPTVNLKTSKPTIKDGVYAGRAVLEDTEYPAGIVIGPKEKVEAHLIGYQGDAYGKEVTLEIGEFIREYKYFKNEADLKQQINEDLKKCQNIL